MIKCPGCSVQLPVLHLPTYEPRNASGECWELFGQLAVYNLERANISFLYQIAVDAYGAQHAGGLSINIRVFFSLIGLCLFNEYNFTGRQIQLAHMKLAKNKPKWPQIKLPEIIGSISIKRLGGCFGLVAMQIIVK